MIALITYICLTWIPPESVLSDRPWHEQRIEIISEEPTLEDIEFDLHERELHQRFQIIEGAGQ